MPSRINDPRHWIDRAADVQARAIMFRLAEAYDKLADRAEAPADGRRPGKAKQKSGARCGPRRRP